MSGLAKTLRTEQVEVALTGPTQLQVNFPSSVAMSHFLEALKQANAIVKDLGVDSEKASVAWRKSETFKRLIADSNEGAVMLRASRAKAGLTQQQLAKALKIEQGHVSEMEHGKRPIGKEMAKRLAKIFKTDYRRFL